MTVPEPTTGAAGGACDCPPIHVYPCLLMGHQDSPAEYETRAAAAVPSPETAPTEGLSEAERGVLLTPCSCGHTLNDHGSLGGCWVCNDEGLGECWVECEALMVERIGRIVAARARALADGGAGYAQGGTGAPNKVAVDPSATSGLRAPRTPFAGDDACD